MEGVAVVVEIVFESLWVGFCVEVECALYGSFVYDGAAACDVACMVGRDALSVLGVVAPDEVFAVW